MRSADARGSIADVLACRRGDEAPTDFYLHTSGETLRHTAEGAVHVADLSIAFEQLAPQLSTPREPSIRATSPSFDSRDGAITSAVRVVGLSRAQECERRR